MAGKEQLLDASVNFPVDDLAIIDSIICSDNDTWEQKTFITEQNNIIGQLANKLLDDLPDKGHMIKNTECHI